jgi:dGTPase
LAPGSADDVRRAPGAVVAFSPAIAEAERTIKRFLETRMYRHARIQRVMNDAAGVVRDLFARYSAHPNDLPEEWQEGLVGADDATRARHIADFIAGMTDRYALAEHTRLFDSTPELR